MEVQVYDLGNPQKTLALANELGRFIKERKLSQMIQGREYVLAEGWQFALSQLGIVPIVTKLENQCTDIELKYRAEVELLRLSDQRIVGRGFAICSNKERTKKAFDEYAIASMAQTRAGGKAGRMLLSWLMKAAGYEGTPYEEIEDTDFADEIHDTSREFLHGLLDTSTFDEDKKRLFNIRIDSLHTWDEYNKAKSYLMANQLSDAERVRDGRNASASDVNKAVRRAVKAEA